MQKKELSQDLPTAIRQAVEDVKQCVNDPKYRIDMAFWYDWMDEICYVCFAGAVMAQRLVSPPVYMVTPNDFEYKERAVLYALNYIRCGYVNKACEIMKLVLKESPPPFPCYDTFPDDNPEQFYQDMLDMADWIEQNTISTSALAWPPVLKCNHEN